MHALESKLESANAITSDLIDAINACETFLNSMEGKNESATKVGGEILKEIREQGTTLKIWKR